MFPQLTRTVLDDNKFNIHFYVVKIIYFLFHLYTIEVFRNQRSHYLKKFPVFMNLVENYCIRQGRNGLLPPLPTGVGPAGSWVLDGADGDLEHRNKLLLCLGTIR